MKVLFLAPRFDLSAGDGVYANNLAASLGSKGVRVEVITHEGNHLIHLAGHGGTQPLVEKAWTTLADSSFSNNYYTATGRDFVEKTLEHFAPDLVHIHGIHQYFTISTALLLKSAGIPTIMTLHDYKAVCGNSGFFSDRTNQPCTKCLDGRPHHPILERCKGNSFIKSVGTSGQMYLWKMLQGLDAINLFHVGSQFVNTILSSNPELKGRLRYIRFPVIGNQTEMTTQREVDIGFVGRFVEHKGIAIFAEAVKTFNNPVHVFGDGPQEKLARSTLSLKRDVTFHGWVNQEVISRYLSLGSIVVLPYLAHETFCFAVLESMMRGCCVVATKRGGIPELIQNGFNGILVDPPTSENFRAAVQELASCPEKVISLGLRARQIVNTLPTLDFHVDEIARLYSGLVGKPRN